MLIGLTAAEALSRTALSNSMRSPTLPLYVASETPCTPTVGVASFARRSTVLGREQVGHSRPFLQYLGPSNEGVDWNRHVLKRSVAGHVPGL